MRPHADWCHLTAWNQSRPCIAVPLGRMEGPWWHLERARYTEAGTVRSSYRLQDLFLDITCQSWLRRVPHCRCTILYVLHKSFGGGDKDNNLLWSFLLKTLFRLRTCAQDKHCISQQMMNNWCPKKNMSQYSFQRILIILQLVVLYTVLYVYWAVL